MKKKKAGPKPHSTPEQLLTQLHAHAAGILAEGVVLSSFKHKGLSGIEREEPVRRFVRTHLPGRFQAGQGAIASSERILGQQHDIIIADRDLSFTLLNTLSAQLFAIESVHLIVEVRSRDNELDSVAKSLRAVRSLRANQGLRQLGNLGSDIGTTPPPVHTIVLYQGPKHAETMITKLAGVNSREKTNGSRVVIDFVLVLAAAPDNIPSSGYLIGYSPTDKESGHTFEHHFYPQVGQEGLDGPKVIAAGSDSFARWYGAILHHLSGVTVYPPSLYSYLGERLTVVPWKEKPY
jgi:hypothetical protein